jgi:hypothetical protein
VRYRFAICRCSGTVTPTKTSPWPYCPSAVLKNRAEERAFAGDASDLNSLATARAVGVGIVAIEQW